MEHPRKDFNCNGAVKHSPEERAPCLEPTMKTKKNSLDKVDVTVHLYNNTGCSGRWTSREKYLTAVCVLLFCACIAFVAVAFIRDREDTSSSVCLTTDCIETAAQLLQSMDRTADPCQDFYQYACGNWNKKHIIPDDRPSFNTFEKLHDDLQIKLRSLLEEGIQDYDSVATSKAKHLYKSCINTSRIEAVGDAPLHQMISLLGGWPVVEKNWKEDSFVVEESLGLVRANFTSIIIIFCSVAADDKNSSSNIIQIDQPDFGMPSREYYLNDRVSDYIHAYLQYMVDTAILFGANQTDAERDMYQVLQLETRIANITKPSSERHDTGAIYNKMSIGDLARDVPKFQWMQYFSKFLPYSLSNDEKLVSFAPEYMKDIADLLAKTDKRTIANYVVWRVVLEFMPDLPEVYQKVRRNYRARSQGITRDKPRWQKCVELTNEEMGMAVGAMFIRENFKKESKDAALHMIHNLREAFNDLLNENDWMDESTRKVARVKAYAMNERIGYPDFIKNESKLNEKYEKLHVGSDYFSNIVNTKRFEVHSAMIKLRKTVDKDQWEQDPAVVNAFYNPNTNDIVFPAGILQPPFYSDKFPKSLNYGGIGVVIGHEITHGFDDKGRQYDMSGNLKQWWKNETIDAFRQRAQCMIDQYSSYKLEQIGLNIDGKNTQGENIADNGGLKQAYRAYKKGLEEYGPEKDLPGIGLTHQQLFFLNYAQIWCGSMRDEEALEKIRTSVHSPGSIRVLGPLSNSYDFSEAYQCPLGSPMNPEKKCHIW